MSERPIRELKPIEPLQQRWEPSPNPADIHIPGLDTDAPINDQNDQIEHMKTLKLQVCTFLEYIFGSILRALSEH